jgi:hypothetical protein
MCVVEKAIGLSHGKAANNARTIINKPIACLNRCILDNLVNALVIIPTPMTAGKVPNPKASMVNALLLTSPAVAASAKAA